MAGVQNSPIKLVIFDVSGTLEDAAGHLYPGVHALLINLLERGVGLALATNLGRGGVARFLQRHELATTFTCAKCADDAPFKPSPEMVNLILLETGISPTEAIMVGDTTADMQMGHHAGMRVCAACWGEGEELLLVQAHPQYIARQPVDVMQVVQD